MAHMKKAHLIGICGAGMSALAILLREAGWKISGSDQGLYQPILGYLKSNKIKFYRKYSSKNIPSDADLIVIGKHTKLSIENSEVKRAFALGIPVKSLPETLAMLGENKKKLVVAGSYGKSTSSALIAWCLMKAKKDPSYFIGAIPIGFKRSSHLGNGMEFIMEGDEYPSSNWDNRSKFLHLNPVSLLLTAAEHDHLNVFPTEKSYIEPYKKLVSNIRKDGIIIYAKEGKNLEQILKNAKCRTVSYSLDNKKSDWRGDNIKYGLRTSFDLIHKNKKVAVIKTKLLGKHNIENIVGVSAFLLEQKLVGVKSLVSAISSFAGVKRRIELKTKNSPVPVYEGFGSSYAKAKSIFDTLALHFPNRKIIAVFEPHTFSWRNREALKWYKTIFNGVGFVILLPPPNHGKNTHDQLTQNEIYNEVKKHTLVKKVKSEKEALVLIKEITAKGDVIALFSSGSLLGLSISVPRLVERLF